MYTIRIYRFSCMDACNPKKNKFYICSKKLSRSCKYFLFVQRTSSSDNLPSCIPTLHHFKFEFGFFFIFSQLAKIYSNNNLQCKLSLSTSSLMLPSSTWGMDLEWEKSVWWYWPNGICWTYKLLNASCNLLVGVGIEWRAAEEQH